MVYTYFDMLSKKVLREIFSSKKVLREIFSLRERRSNATKHDYVFRNYRFVIFRKGTGRNILSSISNNPRCPPFDNNVREQEIMGLSFEEPPCDQEIDHNLSDLGYNP